MRISQNLTVFRSVFRQVRNMCTLNITEQKCVNEPITKETILQKEVEKDCFHINK